MLKAAASTTASTTQLVGGITYVEMKEPYKIPAD